MRKFIRLILMIAVICVLAGCSFPGSGNAKQVSDNTGFMAAVAGNYDSADTAILISKNTSENTITFQNLQLGKRYTLEYDGATYYTDKHGLAVSLDQIREGELVDVTFMKSRKRLNSMSLSADTFHFENKSNLDIVNNRILINDEEYKLDSNLALVGDGETGELMDLASVDVVTLVGFDHMIYSIILNQGHGYLRLENSSFFVGGWIEISQSQIYPIEEDMLLTVPVGTYPVTVSGSGCSGTETITVNKGEEVSLDVSQWQGEELYGTVVFTVDPSDARIYLDGENIDISKPQELSYGIHQMIVIADGYETISKYLKVASENSNMDIVMELKDGASASDNAISSNSASANNVSANAVSDNSVSSNQTGSNSDSLLPIVSAPPSTLTATASATASSSPSASPTASAANSSDAAIVNNTTPTQTVTTSNQYKVNINAPKSVEVYVNGSYIGLSPVSFTKAAGSYDITLRKNGYQTRSYTITVDDSQKDIDYSFSDLLPIS